MGLTIHILPLQQISEHETTYSDHSHSKQLILLFCYSMIIFVAILNTLKRKRGNHKN